MSNIVVPEFLGRLGNNLFQIAATIGYSKKYNVPWAVPPNYHHKAIYEYFPKLPIYKGPNHLPVYDTATDEGFKYKEIPFYSNGVNIRGFWQSVKYFEHCQDEVRSVLRLKENPIEYVGLHIRRGDYVNYSGSFPPITIKYLTEAIKVFTDKGYKDFMVVSDDIPYCRELLPRTFPHVRFKFNIGNPYEDMSILASCEHNIIANSSFSFFAAWYNRNVNKIVVSPSKETWFGPAAQRIDTSTLIPDEWIQIHAR